jgi:hypothetical protein
VNVKKIILNFSLAFIVITCVTTIIGNLIFDNPSRDLAGLTNKIYQLFNIGGYGFIYCITLLIPLLMYFYNVSKKKKYIYYIIIILATIFLSKYSFAIIFSALIISLGIFIKIKSNKKYYFLIASIILFFILRIPISNLIVYITNNVALDKLIEERILSISDFLSKFELVGDAKYRMSLYKQSWNTFIESPLFGIMINKDYYYVIGEHSEILDLLACMGIFGYAIIFIIAKIYGHLLYRKYYLNYKVYFIIFCFMVLLLSLINTIRTSYEIFYVGFILYFMFLYNTEEKDIYTILDIENENIEDNLSNIE